VIPTLIGVTLIIFLFQRLIPGDPAVAMLGEHATQENVERIREQFGLNRPAFLDREALANGDLAGFFDSQYVRYFTRLLKFDLGSSIHRRIPVAETLKERFPATLELAILSLLISLIIGLPVGIASAARRNSALDGVTMVGSLIGVSMPIFWLGIMEIMLFSVFLKWLPSGGRLSTGIQITPITNLLLLDSLLTWNIPGFIDALEHIAFSFTNAVPAAQPPPSKQPPSHVIPMHAGLRNLSAASRQANLAPPDLATLHEIINRVARITFLV